MSENNDQTANEANSEDASAQAAEEIKSAEELGPEARITELESEISQLKNDSLYLKAEFDNYKKQSIKERSDLMKYGGQRLASAIIDAVDIFESALSNEVNEQNLSQFVEGVELTAKSLRENLQKHGIEAVTEVGQPFDPAWNEALGMEPTTEIPEGHIARVFKKAYKYHDRLLRPGQVILAQKPQE